MLGGALEDALLTGLPYSLAYLGVWMTFRLQRQFDLAVDNVFVLGGAVLGGWVVHEGNVIAGVLLAAGAGALAGAASFAVMRTLGLSLILASIIVGTGLFSVNLLIMGQPNLSLFGSDNLVQSWAGTFTGGDQTAAAIQLFGAIALVVFVAVAVLLKTELGLLVRASGLNPRMARGNAGSPELLLLLSVMLGDALVAASGALVAQQQGFTDISMGLGTLIAAVTAILVGEVVLAARGAVIRGLFAVLVGAIVYRLVISLAFRAGLDPIYFQGITAAIVLVLLGMRQAGARLGMEGLARRIARPAARGPRPGEEQA